jgi:N-acetylmuramoyl-L-alanine amidase
LRVGDRGDEVTDLQQRLTRLTYDVSGDQWGCFGPGTAAAVQAFQEARGLRADAVCGEQTWAALVEAGYRLGDRLLYLRQPMLRGDDVAALQRRLGALGFDAGRVDGIFGPQAHAAVVEFQRNTGLTVDGVCGPATVQALERLGRRQDERQPVALVRELELLRQAPRTLEGRRIVVGGSGGLHAVLTAVARSFADAGAAVRLVLHPHQSEQAAEANATDADVFVGLALSTEGDGCWSFHYAGHRYESAGGRRLAELVQVTLPPALSVPARGVRGMALPVLKETQMPAVMCEVGPPERVVAHAAELAAALRQALTRWVTAPVGEDEQEGTGS